MSELPTHSGARRPGDVASAVVSIIGGGLVLTGLPFLGPILARLSSPTLWMVFCLYAAGILAFFTISAIYHLLDGQRAKLVFEALDSGASFLLIAVSWTPFCVTNLGVPVGRLVLGLLWGLGTAGFLATLFMKKQLARLPLAVYYLFFTLAIPLLPPIRLLLGEAVYPWLLLAGLLFAVGFFFRSRNGMPYHHGIWHAFVLAGVICHFFALVSLF